MFGATLQANNRILYTDCGFIFLCNGDLPQMLDSFFSWMNKTVASSYQWLLQSCSFTNSTTSHKVRFTTTATKPTAVLLCRLSVVSIHIKLNGVWKSLTTRRTGFRQFIACCFVSVPWENSDTKLFYCWPFKDQWLLCVRPALTLKHSTFCPHTVFMCFVWIWEQTAIISLYSINWLVCITEKECVYCAVRTERLNMI